MQEEKSEEEEEQKKEDEEIDVPSQEEEEQEATGLGKQVSKYRSKVEKKKKAIKQMVVNKVQVLVAVGICSAVVLWGGIESVLTKLSGLEEVTVQSKDSSECYKLITAKGLEYCVDQHSYEEVEEGKNYFLEKTQYGHRIRLVD